MLNIEEATEKATYDILFTIKSIREKIERSTMGDRDLFICIFESMQFVFSKMIYDGVEEKDHEEFCEEIKINILKGLSLLKKEKEGTHSCNNCKIIH